MSKARVTAILDDLARQAQRSGYSSYEAPVDNYEVAAFEQFYLANGYDAYTAKVTASKVAKSPTMAAQMKQAMNASSMGQGIVGLTRDQSPGNVLAAATFNITVTRDSVNIAEDLPFVLFGPQDYQNGYRNIIGGIIPLGAGTVLTSVRGGESDSLPNSVVFTYTNGANVDTVTVACGTYPYPSFLASTLNDLLRLSKMRLSLSNATLTRQYDLDIVTVSNSPFGKGVTNRVTPSTFKSPEQFQSGIVDLDAVFEVDKETSVAGRIINTAGFTVGIPMFVEKFMRPITKGW